MQVQCTRGRDRVDMLFRTDCGDNWKPEIVCLDGVNGVKSSETAKIEADFTHLMRRAALWLELEYKPARCAYVTDEKQQEFLKGCAFGFCHALNRNFDQALVLPGMWKEI